MNLERPTEKVEIGSVMRFLDFYSISYSSDDLTSGNQSDSVDIYFDRLNLKFQVTTENGSLIKLIRDKHTNDGTKADNATEKYIINPIQKKIDKYQGISTNNITLLITTISLAPINWIFPFDNPNLEKKLELLYQKANFKDIYLLEEISNKVICLYKKY